jgi:fibronectin type 3 domain-containing protein
MSLSARIQHRRSILIQSLEPRRLMSAGGHEHAEQLLIHEGIGEAAVLPALDAGEFAATLSKPMAASGPSLASTVPVFNSLPGAADTLYLDFDGHTEATWGAYKNVTTPEFNIDGVAGFSAAELTAIENIWKQVAEDYAPFNINVTTAPPPSFANGVAMRISIGGNGSWLGQKAGGIAYVDSYTNSIANVAFVFSQNLGNVAKYVAEAVSHEAGHTFGLRHQSSYSGTTKTADYATGSGGRAPIMGNSYAAARGLWWNGTTTSSTTMQDDMSVIAKSANTFGYRPDDHGDTPASASLLSVSGNSVSASGIIHKTTDVDYFTFTTGGGAVSFTMSVPAGINNLDAKLELRYSDGTLIKTVAPSDSFNATLTATLQAGTYRLVAASQGNYGDVGQYTISGTIADPTVPPPPPPSTPTAVAAPSNLSASASNTQISLSWSDNSSNETGFEIQRSTDSNFTNVTTRTVGANVRSFVDTGLNEGTTYYYRVRALGSTSSGYTASVSATTRPTAVSTVTAAASGTSQINLSWTNVNGETGYRIERSTDQSKWTQVGTTGANVTTFANTGLTAGTRYYYRVIALNSAGSSTSPTVSAVTASNPTPPPTTPTVTTPTAPTNLGVTSVSKKHVTLTWTDKSSNESGFYIERSGNNGKGWRRIATVGSNVTTFTDAKVKGRKTYLYRVQSFNAAGRSAYTGATTATTPAKAELPTLASMTRELFSDRKIFG